MIRPSKYMDLDTSVLRIAAFLLSELQTIPAIPLEELEESARMRIGENARFNFIPALNLLYLMNQIDYDDETGSIIYFANTKKN